MDNLKNTTDIRDDIDQKKQKMSNFKLKQYNHEFWVKLIVTSIAMLMVITFTIGLLFFSLSTRYQPHKIYDLPIIITFSAIPLTIVVMFIRYFYKNENEKKTKKTDDSILQLPQLEIVNTAIDQLNKLKDLYKK